MKLKKFTRDDIFHNTIITHPEYEFFVFNKKTYINRESSEAGSFSNKVNNTTQGFVSLYEMNVDRSESAKIHPFITKDGARTAFRTITTSRFQDNSQFQFGDTITGSYPLTASINRVYVPAAENQNTSYLRSLRNPIELGGYMSKDFNYDNISATDSNIIEVPSIFYGSQIKKGSVQLDYYVTGTLLARARDTKKNGQLIQTFGPYSGSAAGVVLYEYGICILTSSLDLTSDASVKDKFFHTSTTSFPNWLSFGSGMRETIGSGSAASSHNVGTIPSYMIKMEGTNKVPTLTMMAHAEKGELNFSTNPTFIDFHNQITSSISRNAFKEEGGIIKNIVKSEYTNFEENYENTTYISQIGIYDKDKNLIAVAKLANPVKKTEARDLLFKLRLDF
tara:strand:+ start:302 stop:1477 length:1176 start_codon:yes stop_codon:yes gene_type:complete